MYPQLNLALKLSAALTINTRARVHTASGGLPPGASSAGITIGATVGGAVVAGVGAAAIGGGFVAYRHFNRPPLPDQLPGQADVFAQGQAYDNTLHIQQGHECFNEVYEENNII